MRQIINHLSCQKLSWTMISFRRRPHHPPLRASTSLTWGTLNVRIVSTLGAHSHQWLCYILTLVGGEIQHPHWSQRTLSFHAKFAHHRFAYTDCQNLISIWWRTIHSLLQSNVVLLGTLLRVGTELLALPHSRCTTECFFNARVCDFV